MRKLIMLIIIMTYALFAQPGLLDQTWIEIDRAQADSIRDPVATIFMARQEAAVDSPWINTSYLPREFYENRDGGLKSEFRPLKRRETTGIDSLGRPTYRVFYRNKKPILLEKIGYSDSKRSFMAYQPEKSRWWKCAR